MWEIQIWDNYGCKLQLRSTFHPFPIQAKKLTLCGSKEVWAQESPVLSVEVVVKVETIKLFVIVLVLPYPPMSLLQKAPPWQFSELVWALRMFRNLTATTDNVEAEKCLNLLKPSKYLRVEWVLIPRWGRWSLQIFKHASSDQRIV